MPQKIAVAVIHGVGVQRSTYAEPVIDELRRRFVELLAPAVDDPSSSLVLEPVFWAPVLQGPENRLWRRVNRRGDLDYVRLRRFMIDFAGDAIAYQPGPREREVYEAIHVVVARALRVLARSAGPRAPLCVIAHSLGTVIASNYIYDMAHRRRRLVPGRVREIMQETPLERGETFACFYTLGSPLAVWSLRYEGFGLPIDVPSPRLRRHHPAARGEWVNFYDRDDVIAYPLRSLNPAYDRAVTRDVEVNVGGPLSSWNPLSHTLYWSDEDVTARIARSLVRLWRSVNE